MSIRRRRTALATLAASVLATPLILAGTTTATAAPTLEQQIEAQSNKIQKAVTAEGVLKHLRLLQLISDSNSGTRAAGGPGYDSSASYIYERMTRAGYDVELKEFAFPFFDEVSPSVLQRTGEAATSTVNTLTFSGTGDVTAPVTAVDVTIPAPATPGSTSGCTADDFAGFPRGNIALVQRGTCTFGVKAQLAATAGASAVIIFNEGQVGRTASFAGTLGAPIRITVVGTSYDVGVQLAATGTVARVKTDTISETRTTRNVIANSKTGRTDNVVMAGAHLDSVSEGAGFNDNGSGSSAILEVALQMAKTKPANQLRFAWWSAEELGLLGSADYVATLSETERKKIALYLNFDMVGSPNFMRGVYDGDGSSFQLTGPPGSAQIEALFNDYFAGRDLPFQATEFSGRSDYQAFINNNIPSGGLFTGAEGIKTAEEASLYGGTAGVAYDPCYHQACDSLTGTGRDATAYSNLRSLVGNVNTIALGTNSDAIAHAMTTYAYDTSKVNGATPATRVRKGKANLLGTRTTSGHHSHVNYLQK